MHLTDAGTALADAPHHSDGTEDARGDDCPPALNSTAAAAEAGRTPGPAADRWTAAAELTGSPPSSSATDPAANVRGGAALLAAAQQDLGRAAERRPGRLVRRGGPLLRRRRHRRPRRPSPTRCTTYSRTGAAAHHRRRAAGRARRAPGTSAPTRRRLDRLGLRTAAADGTRVPGRRVLRVDPGARTRSSATATTATTTWATGRSRRRSSTSSSMTPRAPGTTTLKLVQDPTYVSWHYTLRSSDGHIAQHVQTKDVGLARGQLVRQRQVDRPRARGLRCATGRLVHGGDVPLVGAAGAVPGARVRHPAGPAAHPRPRQRARHHRRRPSRGMHYRPGPVLGLGALLPAARRAPFTPTAGPGDSGLVTIRPDYAQQPAGVHRLRHGAATGRARRTARARSGCTPRRAADAPLVKDIGLRPGGGPSTIGVNDTGARASTGQQYAVAGAAGRLDGDLVPGPEGLVPEPARAADGGRRDRARWSTPKAGPGGDPGVRAGLPGGRRPTRRACRCRRSRRCSTSSPPARGTWSATGARASTSTRPTFDTAGHRVVRGKERYYEIQFGHRVAFVKATDVHVLHERPRE